MTLSTRWQPAGQLWTEMQRFQQDVARMLHNVDRQAVGNWLGFSGNFPALNLWEEGDVIHVEAELPGLQLADLEITVTAPDQLSLKGSRKPATVENATWHRRERAYGAFERVITLPVAVDNDKVEARFEHGVLTIKLPKAEAAKPRKIFVQG